MKVRVNYEILSPERLTTVNLIGTLVGFLACAIPGLFAGVLFDLAADTEDGWWIGGLSTAVLGTIVLTGIVSIEKD